MEEKFISDAKGHSGGTLLDGVASAQHPELKQGGTKTLSRLLVALKTNFQWIDFNGGGQYLKWSLDHNLLTNYVKDGNLSAIYSAAKELKAFKTNVLLYNLGHGILQHTDAVLAGCLRVMIKLSGGGTGVCHGVAGYVNSGAHFKHNSFMRLQDDQAGARARNFALR